MHGGSVQLKQQLLAVTRVTTYIRIRSVPILGPLAHLPQLTPHAVAHAAHQQGNVCVRDLRVLASDGWVLVIGLVLFGAAGFYLFWDSFPRGWQGLGRFGMLILLVLFAGGIAGPMITRALLRRH